MKKLTTAIKHIRRSPYQSIAAMLMTSVTFFIVSVFALVALGGHSLLIYFESRPQVTAFFSDQADQDSAASLEASIKNQVVVESTSYISREQALDIYRDQNQDNPLLLEMVTADILPASLEVSAKNVQDLEKIASIMQADSSVEEVVFQKDVIDVLKSWVNGIRLGGIVLAGVLLSASLATIVIILGLRFTARKTEVNTLSLLGASSWYIRGPFVLEGIFYSIIGAVIGWGSSYLTLLYLTPNLVSFLQGIPLFPVPYLVMLVILGGELVLAAILGSFASLIATRRYGK